MSNENLYARLALHFPQDAEHKQFAQLEDDGIFIAVAAGNNFLTYNEPGLSYPAVSPHVTPVASVDDAGTLSYFSQRNERVLAAPGRGVRSAVPDYAGDGNAVADDFLSFTSPQSDTVIEAIERLL